MDSHRLRKQPLWIVEHLFCVRRFDRQHTLYHEPFNQHSHIQRSKHSGPLVHIPWSYCHDTDIWRTDWDGIIVLVNPLNTGTFVFEFHIYWGSWLFCVLSFHCHESNQLRLTVPGPTTAPTISQTTLAMSTDTARLSPTAAPAASTTSFSPSSTAQAGSIVFTSSPGTTGTSRRSWNEADVSLGGNTTTNSEGGLSKSNQIALGVGIGIGVPALLISLASCLIMCSRGR